MPDEIVLNCKDIHIEYKKIVIRKYGNEKKIMAILTNNTGKHVLENKMEGERKILKIVVNAVVNSNELIATVNEFQEFSNDTIPEILTGRRETEDKIIGIFRKICSYG